MCVFRGRLDRAAFSLELKPMAKSVKKRSPLPRKQGRAQSAPANDAEQEPRGFDIDFDPAEQLKHHASARGPIPSALQSRASPDVLNRLWTIIESRRGADTEVSHSARLLAKGTTRVAQKFGEEAVECLLEVMADNRTGIVGESADVLYHLLVVWVNANIRPEEIWHELEQREKVSHLSEGDHVAFKRLLGSLQLGTTKIP
jgi:phosphoribosyl-ATP pyrophosphohydrolase